MYDEIRQLRLPSDGGRCHEYGYLACCGGTGWGGVRMRRLDRSRSNVPDACGSATPCPEAPPSVPWKSPADLRRYLYR